MRKPVATLRRTPGSWPAKLVCSNSFRGAALANAVGLLKEEMRRAGSLIMACGERARVPAGGAFAVDRERFSEEAQLMAQLHHPVIPPIHDTGVTPDGTPFLVMRVVDKASSYGP